MSITISIQPASTSVTVSSSPVVVTIAQSAISGAAVTWGAITGTLSNQSDLQTQLNSILAISVALS